MLHTVVGASALKHTCTMCLYVSSSVGLLGIDISHSREVRVLQKLTAVQVAPGTICKEAAARHAYERRECSRKSAMIVKFG